MAAASVTAAASAIAGLWHRLPSQCAVCHAWPASRICERCVARFAFRRHRCLTCAMALPPDIAQCGECLLHPPALDACTAALDYAYPWSDAITAFKFAGDPGWSGTLACLMLRAPRAASLRQHAELVLPVPLSRERLAERGFNQALLLARHLALPGTLHSRLLQRVRHPSAQSRLGRRERLRNLQGAFAVEPRMAHRLAGRDVLLIDDVMTTGATLQAAALALRGAGARSVSAWVLARTA
ncbi:MAG: ComF family protein [Burkholderiaceae bacterium]|jgi:ComF family protein|nr:ComF family protein [Burkholderiaceae bacterium]